MGGGGARASSFIAQRPLTKKDATALMYFIYCIYREKPGISPAFFVVRFANPLRAGEQQIFLTGVDLQPTSANPI